MTDGQPDQGFRYWAFISYSHADAAWAGWLHRALESYRIPGPLVGLPIAAGSVPARLRPVFRDRDELPTSGDLGFTIEEALRQSWCLVVVCSMAAAKSRWVDAEVEAFRKLGRGDRIHCLIVDGEPGSVELECFPPALAGALGGRASEPVGADVRPSGDGRSNARLKLVAGILGLRFDKFIRREQQRRHRVMWLVTLASILAAVLFATFAIVTITSRRDADAQRRHAEGLVEFMLGDLRRKLEPDGKLATLDAVGKEALAYYAAQKPESLDADALARRARALQQIGEVYNLRGQLDDALGVFRQAADTTAELLEREPDNGQRIFDHAQSVYWVGYIAYQRGDHASAEPQFQQYKTLAERLVAIDPANEEWQAEVGYANSNLGTLLYEQGRLEKARAVFENELASAQASGLRTSRAIASRLRIAQARAWLADTVLRLGELRDAAAQRNAEITIYEDIIAANPTNNDVKLALSIAERSLAAISSSLGDGVSAITQARRALAFAEELIVIDEENATWMEAACAANLAIESMLTDAGDTAGGRAALHRAKLLAGKLTRREPGALGWQLRELAARLREAEYLARDGDHLESLRVVQGVIGNLADIPENALRKRERTLRMARALVTMAENQRDIGHADDANATFRRALEVMVESSDDGPDLLALRVVALHGIGDDVAASPPRARLESIGYRNPWYLDRVVRSDEARAPTTSR